MSNGYSSMGSFSFDLITPGQCMPLRPRDPLFKESLLVKLNQLPILRMHHNHSAQFLASLENLEESFISLVEGGTLVGHEELEGADAVLHHLSHLLGDPGVPVRDGTVKCIVAVDLRVCSRSPVLITSQ